MELPFLGKPFGLDSLGMAAAQHYHLQLGQVEWGND